MAFRRFTEFQLLRDETLNLRQALEDRKIIERAKGVVMRQSGLDEVSRTSPNAANGTAIHDKS